MTDLHLSEQELREQLINDQIVKAVKTAFPDTNFGESFAPPPLGVTRGVTNEKFDRICLALDVDQTNMWLGMGCLFHQVENALDVTVPDDTMDDIQTIGDFRTLVVAATTGKTTEQLLQAVKHSELPKHRRLLAEATRRGRRR